MTTADSQGECQQKKPQLSRMIEKFSFDMGMDSDEEIFTKKGKPLLENDDIQQRSEEEDDEEPATSIETLEEEIRAAKASKVITKVQAAKKVLKKKNIVPNKKVVFNDDGEIVDFEGEAILGKPLAGVEEKGGIDIELSKQLMREQDRIDKQTYRDKIRSKHREERLKAKAERRAATAGGDVVLDVGYGGDESTGEGDNEASHQDREASNESGEQSNTSDNAIGESETESPDTDSDGGASDEEEGDRIAVNSKSSLRKRAVEVDEVGSDSDLSNDSGGSQSLRHVPKKPMKTKGKFGLKRRRMEGGGDELDTGLCLKGDEELALRLLQG